MAHITNKPNLFFVTSPRSPYKMREEVDYLVRNYSRERWEPNLQAEFYRGMAQSDFFVGSVEGDVAFKARDRITRGPKALGLVNLEPKISLTGAGAEYLYGRYPEEAFTRQLLKFQLPSPYHVDRGETFSVRPYLELLRLTYELEGISKDEIAAFFVQLVHTDMYEDVKTKIRQFRREVTELDRTRTNYKRYFNDVFTHEVEGTYYEQIYRGTTATRQSDDTSLRNFVRTKKSNHIDYADAAIRYLRETQLVSLRSSRSNKIYIPDERRLEVEYILNETPREPAHSNDIETYKEYLFDPSVPTLYSDNQVALLQSIHQLDPSLDWSELQSLSLNELKDERDILVRSRREARIGEQVERLQTYQEYADIVATYQDIRAGEVIDRPAYMEWNTWRAFTMLDDGNIIGNFRFDDRGLPLATAPGNGSDIVCEYEGFDILVEVTLSTGATQHTMEGEPVARHVGNHKKKVNKETYCIFIASSLNPATVAHFYGLHRMNISYYGGRAKIIPMNLDTFLTMLEKANGTRHKPTAASLRQFVERAAQLALEAENESEWSVGILSLAQSWA